MAAPPPGGGLFYSPELNERPYYDGLFQAADTNRTGQIGGQEAVAFFSRSKLPLEQLKNIWTVADNPPTNILDRPKFAVAVRLIQLMQNGVKGQGANLAAPPGATLRPVFLEGVSGSMVPMPGAPQQQQQQQPPPQQGGPPGGPPPQQPQAPSQQQQQQQQPPPQINSDGRPPMPPATAASTGPPGGGGGASMALTVQDPYTLTPSERQRYEGIFPQYAKDDGFMYGKEAVGLFSKSGLNQNLLRDIWNMADQPVDNKLDTLEFAIAMHLIVCISKKNLPMPTVLPMSLKSLKQQQLQVHQQAPPPPVAAQEQQPATIAQAPSYNSQHPPSMAGPPLGDRSVMSEMTQPTLQGPPAITQPGGMGISDAFAGLNTGGGNMGGGGGGGMPPPSSGFGSLGGGSVGGFGGASSTAESASPAFGPTPVPAPSPPRMREYGQPQPAASAIPEPAPKSSEALAQSYNMADTSGELVKLKSILQNLQAENISLKAQLGTMTEDEKEVQKEVNATVSEIGELSNRLTTLRAQVLASKSRLLEATAELKANHEKKGVLNDLIGEAEATKDAIVSAYDGLEASVQAAQSPAPQPAPVAAYETDLFGFSGGAPAPAPMPAPGPAVAAAPSFDSRSGAPQAYGGAPNPYAAQAAAPIPYAMPESSGPTGAHQLETVSDDDSSLDDGQEQFDADPQQVGEPMFTYDQNQDAPNPFGQQQMQYGQQQMQAPDPAYGVSYEQQVFRSNPPPGHNKHNSISSNLSFGEVMGGGGPPQNEFGNQHEEKAEDEIAVGGYGGEGVQSAPSHSMDEINEMKSRAAVADQLAQDSDNTHRQMSATANELRRVADEAEAQAREKVAGATEKKKGGFMGGGKKKKSMKDATQAKSDSESKKKLFLAAQSQANDAQSVAMETKREAEKLRAMVEQAEMVAAAAASMQQKQPAPEPAPAPQAVNGYPSEGQPEQLQQGYGQAYVQPQPPQQQYGQPPAQQYGQPGDYGQPTGNFNPSVMGQPPQGGGMSIPSPAAGNAYSANPF